MGTYEDRTRTAARIATEVVGRHVRGRAFVLPGDHLKNDLGMDSLAVLMVAADVEDASGVTLSNEQISTLSTVADVARAIAADRDWMRPCHEA
jgi:acyl carrier protein